MPSTYARNMVKSIKYTRVYNLPMPDKKLVKNCIAIMAMQSKDASVNWHSNNEDRRSLPPRSSQVW